MNVSLWTKTRALVALKAQQNLIDLQQPGRCSTLLQHEETFIETTPVRGHDL